ncbi:AEC family transporter [Marinivivus vitaminiproducens]|uniref:AEC family transporter n=1 Tax=Marinivivus vitaminiproducens TaxID=3035935 RepID=UPI0027AA1F12|nr:AEC family transporter [Geminicoccaceae bacterium SCSIO 64248]
MTGAIVVALLPIALLIALGQVLRRRRFVPDSFWPPAERLCYFVLLPALLAHTLATANLSGIPVGTLVASLIIPILIVSALLIACHGFLKIDGPAFTSVFQGGVRFNNYVGVTAAVGLFGAAGLPLAAVANATIVPTVNVLCVLVFAHYGATRASLYGIARGIALNPLIVGSAVGIVLYATGLGMPPGIEGFVKALGQASLPLGLLCVGAALDWNALGRGLRPTIVSSVAKFALMPTATALACLGFGLDGRAATIAVLFQSLPTASSSYVMARQLGGDAPLMAGIIASQTVFAALAVPVLLLLLVAG